MPSKVRAVNLHKSYRLNEPFARDIAGRIMRMAGDKRCVELEVVFMDDKSIQKFNKKYRSENSSTDVLSFSIECGKPPRRAFIGEIMISLDTALRNSRRFGSKFHVEIVLYIIHGILHLSGYDDGTAADSRRMSAEQQRILDRLCSCKNLSEVLMPQ